MKNIKPALGTLLLGLSLTTFTAFAQSSNDAQARPGATSAQEATQGSRAAGVMSDEERERRYDAEKKRCDNLQGDEKDVCQKQAEANRATAKAESERRKQTAEASRDANKKEKDGQYDVEKEKCGAMSGDAKDRCLAEVRTRFN